MPSRAIVGEFIAMVEGNRFLEAIEKYYKAESSMQENLNPPRIGLAALLEHERKALASFVPPVIARAVSFAVDGDCVAINWTFEYGSKDGKRHLLDEVAYQVWSGDKIVRERFYYDPGSR